MIRAGMLLKHLPLAADVHHSFTHHLIVLIQPLTIPHNQTEIVGELVRYSTVEAGGTELWCQCGARRSEAKETGICRASEQHQREAFPGSHSESVGNERFGHPSYRRDGEALHASTARFVYVSGIALLHAHLVWRLRLITISFEGCTHWVTSEWKRRSGIHFKHRYADLTRELETLFVNGNLDLKCWKFRIRKAQRKWNQECCQRSQRVRLY